LGVRLPVLVLDTVAFFMLSSQYNKNRAIIPSWYSHSLVIGCYISNGIIGRRELPRKQESVETVVVPYLVVLSRLAQ